jgi:protein-tyrosine phosphatase
VIDIHCHLLCGIDDGPATIEGSLALARAAVAVGTRTIVATPHVSARYPNTPETIRSAATLLRERLAAERIELELLTGAELAMTKIAEIPDAQLARLRLGDSPWLLVEPPFTPVASGIEQTVHVLQDRGYRVILAHPERCPAIHRNPQLLRSLVDRGVLTSVTAGSLVGRFGEHVRRFSLRLAEHELLHNVASDAHDEVNRAPGAVEEIERAGLGPLADWLTRAVPEAVLAGEEVIPARPAFELAKGAGRRRRAWRLRR